LDLSANPSSGPPSSSGDGHVTFSSDTSYSFATFISRHNSSQDNKQKGLLIFYIKDNWTGFWFCFFLLKDSKALVISLIVRNHTTLRLKQTNDCRSNTHHVKFQALLVIPTLKS
jgi:hypothetical protein